ncbi:UDP-3-O-(3-hydroxymyristoyl)glucosamine N-acyltransferase [Alkalinema sp. FACHB-956]|uniref:UDP-3-O-(3-hydroxymyristoyl)glucosamine N-acyltransferase n=1 Tax=Alkalinema sp. FACHB-956 TaxID=2692768 RepID=UPI00168683B7|nr:UDP-3-O-(3-hydroxymyristoyl)glucosamine N-acyltransferase [Alkalinema sp. FACHB-956]MBD2327225.1 UDP-3-O-(3-hydroxymyristoyl)glucosamine N-acyltransferase [Alkalinema sp. FACHB-956]
MKFGEIIEQLGATQFNGDRTLEVTGVAAIDQAQPGHLSYIEGKKFAAQINTTQATVLILPSQEALQTQASDRGIAWIAVKHPRLVFAQAIGLFYQPYKPTPSIHPSAVIDATATIGQNAAISANVAIGENVVIGDDVVIHPNVVIYPNVTIGDRVTLHANCTIQERTQIGNDCLVNSGSVIGSEGFGYVPTPNGWYKMNQSGYVVLEDLVEIGCNCTIDRPAVGETRLKRDTKLDNLIHIGHGVTVGQSCVMAAQVGIAGGTTLGDRVTLAGQVGVANNVTIGDGAIASSKSGIHANVAPGQIVSGYPAVDHKIYLKSSAIYSRLPDMYQVLRQVKKRLGLGEGD